MSLSTWKSGLQDLSLELLLEIKKYIDQATETELALTNKSIFRALTYPTDEPFTLKTKISLLDFYKIKNFIIEERFFEERLVKHILNKSPNIKTVYFSPRKSFPPTFLKVFMSGLIKDRMLTYIVPEDFVTSFQLIDEYEDLCNITISSQLNQKPDVDDSVLKTPEHIERYVQVLFPIDNYTFLSAENLKTDLLGEDVTLDLSRAKQLVIEVAPLFVEFVVILKDHWFLVTSFSIFLHDKNSIDDCAGKSKFSYQETPISFIQRKTSFGTSSFELVLRIGYVELLAKSGFIGSTCFKLLIPFVGSAIQGLSSIISTSIETAITKSIFVCKTQQEYETGNRIINQYYKITSTLPWQFYSIRFIKDGFKPVNPLKFDTEHVWFHSASIVLSSYASQKVDIEDVKKALTMIGTSNKREQLRSSQKLIKQHLEAFENTGMNVFEKNKDKTLELKRLDNHLQ